MWFLLLKMMLFLQNGRCFAFFHCSSFFVQNEDRKLYSFASVMWRSLFVPFLVAGSLQDGGNSTMQGDLPEDRPNLPEVPGEDGDSTSEDLEMLRQEEWARAEETYGLHRPGPNEEVVYVHRQTTTRFAVAPHTWDPIPVGHDVLPDEILDDIARWYNDIFDRWEDITWWLCRVRRSSRSSRQPILAYANYVLVHENDFLAADMRPHGLIELVFGEDQFLFPTLLPRWINWPILPSFLEPISARAHFGIVMHGLYNGNSLGHRLVRCANGFFIQVHYEATLFLLSELFHIVLPCMPLPCGHFAGFSIGIQSWRRTTNRTTSGMIPLLSIRWIILIQFPLEQVVSFWTFVLGHPDHWARPFWPLIFYYILQMIFSRIPLMNVSCDWHQVDW